MAGGASGSKQSILEELIDSLKKTGEDSVSTEVALGFVQQNASLSLEAPSFHHQEVQHRATMVHAVMRPAPIIHEDYAIISIDPLPNHLL
jgi:hypothetical protein